MKTIKTTIFIAIMAVMALLIGNQPNRAGVKNQAFVEQGDGISDSQQIDAAFLVKYMQSVVGLDAGPIVFESIYADGNTIVMVAVVKPEFGELMKIGLQEDGAIQKSKNLVIIMFKSNGVGAVMKENFINVKYIYKLNNEVLATVGVNYLELL